MFILFIVLIHYFFVCWVAELMVLGFISLLLTFGQNYISKMCIPEALADKMLPCKIPDDAHPKQEAGKPAGGAPPAGEAGGGGHRRLLSYQRRFLAGGGGGHGCKPVINYSAFLSKGNASNTLF